MMVSRIHVSTVYEGTPNGGQQLIKPARHLTRKALHQRCQGLKYKVQADNYLCKRVHIIASTVTHAAVLQHHIFSQMYDICFSETHRKMLILIHPERSCPHSSLATLRACALFTTCGRARCTVVSMASGRTCHVISWRVRVWVTLSM